MPKVVPRRLPRAEDPVRQRQPTLFDQQVDGSRRDRLGHARKAQAGGRRDDLTCDAVGIAEAMRRSQGSISRHRGGEARHRPFLHERQNQVGYRPAPFGRPCALLPNGREGD